MRDLPRPAYIMSEPHLSGWRVVIGYATLKEAQDAHDALALSGRPVNLDLSEVTCEPA